MKAKLVPGALVFLALLPVSSPAGPDRSEKRAAIDINGLVRQAAASFKAREDLRNDYTYLAHYVWSSFDTRGRRPRPSTADFEIVFLEGEPYMREIKYNDQPLPPEQEQRQLAMMEAFAKARREAKSRPGGLPAFYTAFELPVAQLPDAFDLHMKGRQRLDDREVYVIEALPKVNQNPADAGQEHARHFKMKLWIDPEEAQIVKIEATVVRELVVTGVPTVLGPIANETLLVIEPQQQRFLYKAGSVIGEEWTRLDDGAWLPKHTHAKIQERIWLELPRADSSPWREVRDCTYSGYKKFRVKATIVP
ncbi:MAG TPA: hypothetical protein VHW72_00335 [Candidatus Angelobacter sp.]|nr:hypothetical protein [Candidatus Angelobacter sp.]